MTYKSESGHWYKRDGTPAYTQPNKSKPGETRNTTIRDARKLDLVPSVTTVLNVAAKPGLEAWKRNQVLMSALTLPKIEGEGLSEFSERIKLDAEQQVKDAMDEGTRIHGIIESYFESGDNANDPSVKAVADILKKTFGEQDWLSEKSFASPDGFGGKIDLHSNEVVVDYKTKEFTEQDMKKPFTYDEHILQLSAYRKGLGLPNAKIANVFVSRTVPGLVKLEVHDDDYWDRFKCLLDYWKLKNGYKC